MDVIGQITAVAGVMALLLGSLWWLRRQGYAQITAFSQGSLRPSGRRMVRLEKLVLSPQHTLHLVRLGDTSLLVAASPAGCFLIRAVPLSAVDEAGARQGTVR
jgi:hypothetical protein